MDTKQQEILLLQDIKKRLEVLISLQVVNSLKGETPFTSRDVINFLSSLDLKYTEIAAILGKTPSYISSELTVIKKNKKKGSPNESE